MDAQSANMAYSRGARIATVAAGAVAAAVLVISPDLAYAADAPAVLDRVLGLAVTVCQLIGGALVVYGGVKFGLAIKDQQGGSAMSEALATIGGGAIVFAAGSLFSTVSDGLNFNV